MCITDRFFLLFVLLSRKSEFKLKFSDSFLIKIAVSRTLVRFALAKEICHGNVTMLWMTCIMSINFQERLIKIREVF